MYTVEPQTSTAAFQLSMLNALPANVCLIDDTGRILAVNHAWIRFGAQNGLRDSDAAIGQNYFEVCMKAEGDERMAALDAVRGIRAVLSGEVAQFTIKYPCHSPQERRWFRMIASPIQDGDRTGAVIMHINITEQRLIEEALAEQFSFLQQLLNAIPIPILYKHANGRFLGCNSAYERLVGLPRECIIGRTLHELWPKSIADLLHQRDIDLLQKGGDATFELQLPQPDGRMRDVIVNKATYRDRQGAIAGIVGAIVDISAQKQTARALEESEERFRATFEHAAVGMALVATTGRFLRVNRRLCQILGYKADELTQKTLPDVTYPEDALPDLAQVGHLLAGPCSAYTAEKRYVRKDGTIIWVDLSTALVRDADGAASHFILVVEDITEQKAMVSQLQRVQAAIEQTSDAILITGVDGTIQYVNPAFERTTGYTRAEVLGQTPRLLKSGKHKPELYCELWETILNGRMWRGRLINRRKDGSLYEEDTAIAPVSDTSGHIVNFVSVKRDVTREVAMETELRQAQKLEAIGQLAAGIAHEINTPTQYVGDNIRFLQDAFNDVAGLLAALDRLLSAAQEGSVSPELIADVTSLKEQADVEYLMEEIPNAITQSLEGVGRVTTIVRAMKEFSHPGSEEMTPHNLNRAIQSTITVARNEWKYVAEMATDFDEDLPLVPCRPGEFNQVILNLITNAAHAIASVVGDGSARKGTITVRTRRDGDWAEIRVSDTGSGIPEEVQHKIFEPFFTTKDVGRGTGQGLTLARAAIVERHKGTITFETEPGKGTTFIVRLPLVQN